MSLALSIAGLAASVLPEHRRDWGDAMAAEVAAIDEPREALQFAVGCLWAAVTERITFMKAFVFAGRLSVGIVTALYGAAFLRFLYNGLTGMNPHPYMAFLAPWQIAMGLTHLAAAAFLVFWRPKAFLWTCAAAALPGLALSTFGMVGKITGKVSAEVSVFAFAWPFLPLVMLMGAAWLFAWLEQAPKRPAVA
jgi:hypothetical protein